MLHQNQLINEHILILDKLRLNAERHLNVKITNLIVIYGPKTDDIKKIKNGLITGSLTIEEDEDFLSKALYNQGDQSFYDCYYDSENQIENALQIIEFTQLVDKAQQVQLFLAIPDQQIEYQLPLLYDKIKIILNNSHIIPITLIITQSTHKYQYNGNSRPIRNLIEGCLYLPSEENHQHNNHFLRQLENRKKEKKNYLRIVRSQTQNKMRDPQLVNIAQNCVNEIKNYNENLIFQFYKQFQKMIQDVSKLQNQFKNDLDRHIRQFVKKIEQFNGYNQLFYEINTFIAIINEWGSQIPTFSQNIQQSTILQKIDDYIIECDDLLEYYSNFYLTTHQSGCYQQLLNYLKYVSYEKSIFEEIQIYRLGEFDNLLDQQTSYLNQINAQYKIGVLFFGQIRVGKSTLVNLLSGNELKLVSRGFTNELCFDCENQLFKIGHQAISQTSRPQFYNDDQNKITLIDIPGFGDQGNEFNDDINKLIIQEIYSKFEKVVTFLVIDFHGLINNVAMIGELMNQFKTQFGIKDNLLENINLIITKSDQIEESRQQQYQQFLQQNYNSNKIQNFNADQFLKILNTKSVYFYKPNYYLDQSTKVLDQLKLNVTKQSIFKLIDLNQPQIQFENAQQIKDRISEKLKPHFEALKYKTSSSLLYLKPLFQTIIIEAYLPISHKKLSLNELIQILSDEYQLDQIQNLLIKLKMWMNKYYQNNSALQNKQIEYMIKFSEANHRKKIYQFCEITIDLSQFKIYFEELQNDIDHISKQFEHIENIIQCLNTFIIFAGTIVVAPVIFKGALTIDLIKLFLQRSAFTIRFNIMQNMMNGQQINLQQIQHQELQRNQK